ncbi:hypothetical protein HN446_02910 [bacterium]|jgi:hypothetical protein|nr:hypothetical protein [bacterium]
MRNRVLALFAFCCFALSFKVFCADEKDVFVFDTIRFSGGAFEPGACILRAQADEVAVAKGYVEHIVFHDTDTIATAVKYLEGALMVQVYSAGGLEKYTYWFENRRTLGTALLKRLSTLGSIAEGEEGSE